MRHYPRPLRATLTAAVLCVLGTSPSLAADDDFCREFQRGYIRGYSLLLSDAESLPPTPCPPQPQPPASDWGYTLGLEMGMEEGCAVPRTTDAWHPVIQIWPPELTNLKTRACGAAALKSYRERLAGVRNGEVWGADDPGPYTDDEKAREIARLEGAIASIGSLGEELEAAIASTRCRSPSTAAIYNGSAASAVFECGSDKVPPA